MNATPPLRLFLDRSTQGRRFIAAVRAISDATAGGGILVGADQLRGPLEKATVRTTCARYVVFGRNNRRMSFMIAKFAEHLPEIRTLTAMPGPWIHRISQHDFAELPLDRPGR